MQFVVCCRLARARLGVSSIETVGESTHLRIPSDSISDSPIYFSDVASLHQSTVDWFSAFEIPPNAASFFDPMSLFYRRYPSVGCCRSMERLALFFVEV